MSDATGPAVRALPPEPPAGAAADAPVDAPPVLLVHGFGSDGAADWIVPGTAGAIAATGRAVVVPDLAGHGAAPAPASAAEATAPALARDLLAVMDGAGADRFDIVGYSLGARLAWEVVARAPERVERAVLGGLSPAEPFTAVDVAALHRAVTGGDVPDDPFTAAIAGMLRQHGDRARGLALCVEGLRSTPFTGGRWPGRVPPVLVVGENDDLAKGIDGLVEHLGEARLVTVPGGHLEALGGTAFRGAVLDALAR
ncbi:alpha/beta fold hydrolase [Actinomadura gamaensis]|uniref:Alpha/beta fold hydrolase n=1 Tax=Actinomadura gamaensis TaxID=1763541 RepID=A0ABV9TW96_9ACTN